MPIGFIGGFLTPTRLDGAPTRPFWQALAIDLGLLGLFAVQHSVMARPAFKRWWTRFVPEAVERSTYVLLSSLALVALFVWWEPMGGIVWDTSGPVRGRRDRALSPRLGTAALHDLPHRPFRPVRPQAGVAAAARKPLRPPRFYTPSLYRIVRHPLYIGWLTIFWAAPTMTVAHLVFALATTAYILIAIRFEEHDLVDAFGERYVSYRRSTPMLVPRLSAPPGADRQARRIMRPLAPGRALS